MDATRHPISNMAPPALRLSIGITGHRESNPAFAANRDAIAATLSALLDALGQAAGSGPVRLHSLLAHGADLMAVETALAQGWEIVAPLPFGLDLNIAINARPESLEDARALVAGKEAAHPDVALRADHIRDVAHKVRRFELADQDALIAGLFLGMYEKPGDVAAAQFYSVAASDRAAIAGRTMIEQSDVLIGIWDGSTQGAIGGTRHTIATALDLGTPVVWIDASAPSHWRLLNAPESLAALADAQGDVADLEKLAKSAVSPETAQAGPETFHAESWHRKSHRRFHAYRRIEAISGGRSGGASRWGRLVQTYETPDAVASGSGASLLARARALPGGDPRIVDEIETSVLRRFAWADGLSTYLSDAYRGGMTTNFALSAFAIVGGIAYLPLASAAWKWPFALFELLVLATIVAITTMGVRYRWHGRWFETRRVAEYLRHAPIMLLLGVSRAPGRWPRGKDTLWPEVYARGVLREVGLPALVMTPAYLRSALGDLLARHVEGQRSYHEAKAKRLTAAHHNLDRLSEACFTLAVIAVSAYLLLAGAGALGWMPSHVGEHVAKPFTFLGVLFPTFGAAIAGIRYFGDFERFAAISDVTAEKLESIGRRIHILLDAPDSELSYSRVTDLAHAVDEVVVSEIENWQAVFGGKHITVPV